MTARSFVVYHIVPGMFHFIEKYLVQQNTPLPKLLLVFGIVVPPSSEVSSDSLYLLRMLKVAISRCLRNRTPLPEYKTPADAVALLRTSRNIVVLTGAGISTSCGIPDFRSPQGLYSRLVASGKYPTLSDPQEMFDIAIFKENPELFYDFAKEIYPTKDVRRTSRTHRWIRRLETEGEARLLRNYTQNIDTLEKTAGIEKVLFAHGSFATCSCLSCGARFPGEAIQDAIYAQTVPLCPICSATIRSPPTKRRRLNSRSLDNEDDDENDYGLSPYQGKALLKPDITFFGQALDDDFDKCLHMDREKADLLVVIGTSLQVAPVSELLSHLPHRIPQILINRDPVPHVMNKMDIVLLGDCDKVISWLEREAEKAILVLNADHGPTCSGPREKQGRITTTSSPTFHVPPLPEQGVPEHDEKEAVYAGLEPVLALPSLPLARFDKSVNSSIPHQGGHYRAASATPQAEITNDLDDGSQISQQLGKGIDNIWLFPGANDQHRWFQAMREALDEADLLGESEGEE